MEMIHEFPCTDPVTGAWDQMAHAPDTWCQCDPTVHTVHSSYGEDPVVIVRHREPSYE